MRLKLAPCDLRGLTDLLARDLPEAGGLLVRGLRDLIALGERLLLGLLQELRRLGSRLRELLVGLAELRLGLLARGSRAGELLLDLASPRREERRHGLL